MFLVSGGKLIYYGEKGKFLKPLGSGKGVYIAEIVGRDSVLLDRDCSMKLAVHFFQCRALIWTMVLKGMVDLPDLLGVVSQHHLWTDAALIRTQQ